MKIPKITKLAKLTKKQIVFIVGISVCVIISIAAVIAGATGLYETWHYRYVGIPAATEIATGKYNGGSYDSLEHYLKSIGLISDLLGPSDCNY